MNIVKGDLIKSAKEGQFDVIIHGCNCFNTMGAGIAKLIKQNFYEAYLSDKATKRGDKSKLGAYSCALIGNVTIINAYTQYYYGNYNKVNLDYDALRDVFKKIKKNFTGKKIAFPKIGAGLGGGDWYRISNIIESELHGENMTLVIL